MTNVIGNLLILAGVGCCALYTVLTRRIAANLAPLLNVALQQTAALFWALLIWPAELLHRESTHLVVISSSMWAWGGGRRHFLKIHALRPFFVFCVYTW